MEHPTIVVLLFNTKHVHILVKTHHQYTAVFWICPRNLRSVFLYTVSTGSTCRIQKKV